MSGTKGEIGATRKDSDLAGGWKRPREKLTLGLMNASRWWGTRRFDSLALRDVCDSISEISWNSWEQQVSKRFSEQLLLLGNACSL